MPSSADRLLPAENQVYAKLYDAESIMAIPGNVANGFVVLLHGGPPPSKSSSSKTKQSPPQDDVSLAFMALTSGNVLDACFGVSQPSRRVTAGDRTPAGRAAADAKALLGECDTNDTTHEETFKRTAVRAYGDAFKVVVVHADKMQKLNCFTRCFRTKKIRTQTEKDLREAFAQLAQMINEQSH